MSWEICLFVAVSYLFPTGNVGKFHIKASAFTRIGLKLSWWHVGSSVTPQHRAQLCVPGEPRLRRCRGAWLALPSSLLLCAAGAWAQEGLPGRRELGWWLRHSACAGALCCLVTLQGSFWAVMSRGDLVGTLRSHCKSGNQILARALPFPYRIGKSLNLSVTWALSQVKGWWHS